MGCLSLSLCLPLPLPPSLYSPPFPPFLSLLLPPSFSSHLPFLLPTLHLFIPPTPPQSLHSRNPQLIFAHFHFLLDDPALLTRFMHIVHAQPFDDRKNWFYENLYQGKPPNNELTLAAESNAIMVDRGKHFRSFTVSLSITV